ncbi:MAG: Yip1 family protein [Bacillota bacterium]|nr:Yip1 family protein [Bacillota bacterium]
MENNIQQLSFGEKIKNFFIHPSRVFEQYKEKPTFWLKLIVFLLVGVIMSIITTIKSRPEMEKYMTETLKKAGGGLQTADSVKQIVAISTNPVLIGVMGLITFVVVVLIASLIYFGLIKLLKGQIKFSQMLAVYTLASMPVVIGDIVKTIYMLAANKSIGSDKYHPSYMNTLTSNLDIFIIWQIVLLIIGISTVSGISKKKSTALVLILNVLSILLALVSVAFTINNMKALG